MFEGNAARLKPRIGEKPQPILTCEQAFEVSIVLDVHGAVGIPHQKGVVDHIRVVCRVRIPRPLHVSKTAPALVGATA